MAEHNILGREGEDLAQQHLRAKGYRIVETNWRFAGLEVDIIAQKDNVLAIVEVKTRTSDALRTPQQAVDALRQKRLITAANAYVHHNGLDCDVRMDIIAIVKNEHECRIEHIENAYQPMVRSARSYNR